MMSHRFALEKSHVLAGFACGGGTLIRLSHHDDSVDKKRFSLLPMPAYVTGGTTDVWFQMAGANAVPAWVKWNGCSSTAKVSNITLTGVVNKQMTQSLQNVNKAVLSVHSSCAVSTIQVVSLNATGMGHIPDSRMAKYSWDFLSKYKRSGALSALPPLPPPPSPPTTSTTSTPESSSASCAMASLVVLAVALGGGF
jgi:hypothetical protein